MGIDVKNHLWSLLAVAFVISISVVRWAFTQSETKRETQVNFGEGTVDCESLMNDTKRVELRAWLTADEGRTIIRATHEASLQLVEELYTRGAKEVLIGNVDADAGTEGEVARDYVIVPPPDPEARRAFLRAWGGPVLEIQDAHKRCLVVYGT